MIEYRLRIQRDDATFYGELYRPEGLSAALLQAEALIADALPEGWYAKIEDGPQSHAVECDMDEDCLCDDGFREQLQAST